MDLNPISHYNPIIAPLIKILDPPLVTWLAKLFFLGFF
jgi:hypothetical protein